ncbi:MAG: DUF1328 domain-containing protein [Gammaproteobacteria bacterium]
MLRWSFIFLIITVIAGLLAFTSIAALATEIARVMFFTFVAMFIVTLVVYLKRRAK